jgi:hypothetical protein
MEDESRYEKITVNIPRWMRQWIENKAREEGESEAVIVRRLLRKAIRQEEGRC